MVDRERFCRFEGAYGFGGKKLERNVAAAVVCDDELAGVPLQSDRRGTAKNAFVWIEIGEYAHATISLIESIVEVCADRG